MYQLFTLDGLMLFKLFELNSSLFRFHGIISFDLKWKTFRCCFSLLFSDKYNSFNRRLESIADVIVHEIQDSRRRRVTCQVSAILLILYYITIKGILWDRQWKPALLSGMFQSDPSSNYFTIDVWKKWWIHHFIFLPCYCYLYLILHKFCSVLTCDLYGIGLF